MATLPRFPIYVISKGRATCCLTADFLLKDRILFRLVVEPQEADAYAAAYGSGRLDVLPFSNLGLGSIPARNWVWDDARARGAERHWILDDNIIKVFRRRAAIKIPCYAGVAFAACEDFTCRYENVAISGMNYEMFAVNKAAMPPFAVNQHVYSNFLIRNDLPYRWRGRYNEDADLCLQVLAGGWCTILFNAFLAYKKQTMTMKGGNTTELYQGDGRLKMARSLERLWPGVVTTDRRWQRPQHVVKDAWKRFDTPLRLKEGVDLSTLPKVDEYGMRLTQVKPIKSETLRALVADRLAPAPVSDCEHMP